MKWQRVTRIVLALVAVAFAAGVALTMRSRQAPAPDVPVARTDEKAVLEGKGGLTFRVNKSREQVRVEYEKWLTYADGSTRMLGVKVTTEREGKTFVMTGKEGQIAEKEAAIEMTGDVRVVVSDGLTLATDRATYTEANGVAQAPGNVTFARGRMTGAGVGFTYDKNQDILVILDQATVHVEPESHGAGAMDVASGGFEFRRNEDLMRFDRAMKATREREIIEADTAVAHLDAAQEQVESLELRGQSKVVATEARPGGLQMLSGRDIDLKYGPDGRALEHALISGDGLIQIAGEAAQPGRQIAAESLDISMAADGATPTALAAKQAVKLTLPGERNGVGRTIAADTLDCRGDAQHGLTTAHFFGNVQFAERGAGVSRAAWSVVLDVALGPGFGSIDEARFTRSVRFVDGAMTATSAAARYALDRGTLELTGSEPGTLAPHVVNDTIMIDAVRIDVTLEGPLVVATGAVKSVLQPTSATSSTRAPGDAEVKMPAMLKQDQPVNVTAANLNFDGRRSVATYDGAAQLWQGDTLIKAPRIEIDGDTGNLSAEGPVATVSTLVQEDKDGRKERVPSRGTAKAFRFEDATRRATYTGDAHLSGPQGDLTANRIELFLKPSGDELDRVEAYETVNLRSDAQKTTGTRLTYFGDEGRYLVRGAPVTIVDECGRATNGRTLTFFKSTDRIVVDGNEQIRTQSTGKSNCPGQ